MEGTCLRDHVAFPAVIANLYDLDGEFNVKASDKRKIISAMVIGVMDMVGVIRLRDQRHHVSSERIHFVHFLSVYFRYT